MSDVLFLENDPVEMTISLGSEGGLCITILDLNRMKNGEKSSFHECCLRVQMVHLSPN